MRNATQNANNGENKMSTVFYTNDIEVMLEKGGFRASAVKILSAASVPVCSFDLQNAGAVYGRFGMTALGASRVIAVLCLNGLLSRSYNSLSMPMYQRTARGSQRLKELNEV